MVAVLFEVRFIIPDVWFNPSPDNDQTGRVQRVTDQLELIDDLKQIAPALSFRKVAVMHSGFAEPMTLGRMVAEGAALWPGLTIQTLMPPGPCPYVHDTNLKAQTLLPHSALRESVNSGRVEIVRESLFAHSSGHSKGTHKADILFLQVSPPDAEGKVSLGLSVSFIPQMLLNKPLVIAQINSSVPNTGYSIPLSCIDYALVHEKPLPVSLPSIGGEVDQNIAAHVVSLLNNGITLEIGIGAIPEAVLHAANQLDKISIHTGLINDAIMPLANSGKLTGPIVTTMAMGTERFYRWLDNNEGVKFVPVSQTHDPELIGQISRFHAVNGALQVDLAGNINAERVNGKIISCPGGLPDFAAGACRSKGGKSIIALRSTVGKSNASTLVDRVECKTLDASLVDYIVTEYGIARVRGLSPTKRATAIRSIAHPDHRDTI